MNEIVKYHNALNQLQLSGFRAIDYDIFMGILTQVRDKGTERVLLQFDQIRKLIKDNSKTRKDFIKALKEHTQKLQDIKLAIQIGDEYDENGEAIPEWDRAYMSIALFPTVYINPKEETLEIAVNKVFVYILNQLVDNYTEYELASILQLKSKYAKALFNHLMQFKSTGIYCASIADIRKALDIPNAYETKYIEREVVKPAVQELQEHIKGLSYEKLYAKGKGKPLYGFKFAFIAMKKRNTAAAEQSKNQHKAAEDRQEAAAKKSKNSFNNFMHTEYDFEDLEKRLLGE